MSDKGRRLSKRSGAIKKRETLDEKLRKRLEESKIQKQKTLAKNRKVKLSDTAKDSDKSLSPNSSINVDTSKTENLQRNNTVKTTSLPLSLESDDLEITNKEGQSVAEEEPVLDKVFEDALDGSIEVIPNLNMANPKYAAKLKEIKRLNSKSMTIQEGFCQIH